MILLPWPPRRATLIGFCLSIALLCGVVTGAMLWLFGIPRWPLGGLIAALVLVGLGVWRLDTLHRPYAWWNKAARRFSRAASLWVTSLCFYLIFTALGKRASAVQLERPASGESLWIPRAQLDASRCANPLLEICRDERGWLAQLFTWVRRSQNWWAVWLVFPILLLRLFDNEQAESFPTNNYTLY